MHPDEIRQTFIRFFEERGHRVIPSAPIVPPGDPTLLFTSAGMVPFKAYFMGQAEPPSRLMVSIQKCFRTTDIESVGDTSHQTLFEMMGNFSVGEYFKDEMIPMAWEFCLKHLNLDPERIWATIYLDDDEAYDLWIKTGVPQERIVRYGEDENYWFAGDVGPCGPDSELYYDFGEEFGCGPDCHPAHTCLRFLEFWNLVFMTYYCDGEKRDPLPQKNIDTGAGVERQAIIQLFNTSGWDKGKVPSAYDTELFMPLIRRIEELSGAKYGVGQDTDRILRIIAEHTRAITFLIGDERMPVIPSNEEQGYVCRRLLRRAMYYMLRAIRIGHQLPADFSSDTSTFDQFFAKLALHRVSSDRRQSAFTSGESFLLPIVDVAIDIMKATYPELERQRDFVVKTIAREEETFYRTLAAGEHLLREVMAVREAAYSIATQTVDPKVEFRIFLENFPRSRLLNEITLPDVQENITAGRVPAMLLRGREAFVLHDRYGFPIELTREIATQEGFAVDEDGFLSEMEMQRERARSATELKLKALAPTVWSTPTGQSSDFLGYATLESPGRVLALQQRGVGGQEAEVVRGGAEAQIVLDRTPFYPEGGGQVGDRGEIRGPNGRMEVIDTQRLGTGMIVHRGPVLDGVIRVDDEVTARVDVTHRANTKRNHTATHLLHAALRQVIGPHVRQAGSLVAPDRLRFDFTATEAATPEQLTEVEMLVNEKVRQDIPVHVRESSFDEAMEDGVLAFFGDKYGERVRVVEVNTVVPRFSAELCGGTHCERTGEIGLILITGESSIGSGMRRIEALSGVSAERYVRELREEQRAVAERLRVQRNLVAHGVDVLIAERDTLKRRDRERMTAALSKSPEIGSMSYKQQVVDGIKVRTFRPDAPSTESLRMFADNVRKQFPDEVVVLGSVVDDKPMFIALVPKDLTSRGLHAGNLLKKVATVTGGNAGGRPDMAQGGGKDVSRLEEALGIVPDAVKEMLNGG